MKTTIAFATLLYGSVAVSDLLAQGHFQWGNFISGVVRSPIYGLDPANPTQPRTGNTAAGVPAGNQTYGGVPLEGTRYTAAIYTGDTAAQVLANMNSILLPQPPFEGGFLVYQRPFKLTWPSEGIPLQGSGIPARSSIG